MKKEKNKLIITVVVSLILSSVIEMILVMSNTNTLSIERVLVLMSIISFIVLNFVIDRKKLYDVYSESELEIVFDVDDVFFNDVINELERKETW